MEQRPRPTMQALAATIEAQQSEIERLKSLMGDTNAKVTELHRVLMVPAPGHDRALVERFASVTLWAESASRMGYGLKWIAGVVVALGIMIAAVRLGQVDGARP